MYVYIFIYLLALLALSSIKGQLQLWKLFNCKLPLKTCVYIYIYQPIFSSPKSEVGFLLKQINILLISFS